MALERVQKIMSNAGFCSRRRAEEMIESEMVSVNGKLITIGDKADPFKDKITIGNQTLTYDKKVYLALNKPKNYITTLDDPRGRKTVLDLIDIPERVIPVGRLDRDTEGLLLLTNDGDFANKVTHPRYEVQKTYFVKTAQKISGLDLKKLENGVFIDKRKTSRAYTKRISPNAFTISIHEGRNRIVRKMVEIIGNKVSQLKRMSVGTIRLGTLKPSQYRLLTQKEVDSLMKVSPRENITKTVDKKFTKKKTQLKKSEKKSFNKEKDYKKKSASGFRRKNSSKDKKDFRDKDYSRKPKENKKPYGHSEKKKDFKKKTTFEKTTTKPSAKKGFSEEGVKEFVFKKPTDKKYLKKKRERMN